MSATQMMMSQSQTRLHNAILRTQKNMKQMAMSKIQKNMKQVKHKKRKMTNTNLSICMAAHMDALYGPRTGQYDLRARKPRDYAHLHATIENDDDIFDIGDIDFNPLETTAITQHSARKGLRLFGTNRGIDAVTKELTQLHDRGVLEPKDAKELTEEERKAALQYLMFLKEKRNGTVKGRGCADGHKQRATATQEEASSPTVAIESVMLSCIINAKEERDVGIVDLPGAFMQADMEDTVHMKLKGKMAKHCSFAWFYTYSS